MAYESLPLFPHVRPEKPKKGLTPTQAAYLAGLLDGEGYFRIERKAGKHSMRHRPGYMDYRCAIMIAMTSRPLLEEVAAMIPWGRTRAHGISKVLQGRARPPYFVKWVDKTAAKICRAILPYLRLKKPHAELIIRLDDEKERVRKHAGNKRKPHFPAALIEMHAMAMDHIRVLNKRGQENEPGTYHKAEM